MNWVCPPHHGISKDFYAVFTPENVLARVRDVYAKDAYLTDALRELNGIEDIEAYMLRLLD